MPNNDARWVHTANTGYWKPICNDGEQSFPNLEAYHTHALACAIIEQAVYDWVALDYGWWDRVPVRNYMVFAQEVREFFQSPWFEYLLSFALPDVEPETVRKRLKIPERGAA